MKLKTALGQIEQEVQRAKQLYPANFHNQHEAYAVILEEIDELWSEIKKKQSNYDLGAQIKEAVQAAAMLVRFLTELMPDDEPTELRYPEDAELIKVIKEVQSKMLPGNY